MLFLLGGAGEEEGAGGGRFSAADFGNEVEAAEPVRFGEVGLRPLGRVIGMGVVEAGDFEATQMGVAQDGGQIFGRDPVAVAWRLFFRVGGGYNGGDLPAAGGAGAEENAATLVGIGALSVGVDGFGDWLWQGDHGARLSKDIVSEREVVSSRG